LIALVFDALSRTGVQLGEIEGDLAAIHEPFRLKISSLPPVTGQNSPRLSAGD